MLFALAGFACLSVGDGLIKSLGGSWPGSAVAALRYAFGALGLGAILFLKEGRAGFRLPLPWVQLARGFSVALATIAFFSSIFLMPLASATAIQFISPMLTALLSAVFLREPISRGALLASLLAFVGVIIVLRPSFVDLGWVALMPLVAAIGMSWLMMANRQASGSGSVLLMQFLIAAIAAPILIAATAIGHFSGFEPLQVGWPDDHTIMVCATVAITASVAHMLIYIATDRSSAATVAPMVYVQILVAIAIGVIFYQDYPDQIAMAGTALIIASGLYLWSRGRA